jgi:hypothetical protein
MDTFVGEAIVMFGINKVVGTKKRFPVQSGSSRVYRQNPLYRIFPQGKKVLSCKGQVVGIFPVQQPSLTVLLDGIGGGDKAVPA